MVEWSYGETVKWSNGPNGARAVPLYDLLLKVNINIKEFGIHLSRKNVLYKVGSAFYHTCSCL